MIKNIRKIGVAFFGGSEEIIMESCGKYYFGVTPSNLEKHLSQLYPEDVENFDKETELMTVDLETEKVYVYLECYPKEKLQYLYHNPWDKLRYYLEPLDNGKYMSLCQSIVYDFIYLDIQGIGETAEEAEKEMNKIIEELNSDYDEEKVNKFLESCK